MILVVGATGSLGGRTARGLLERGHPVRALVRSSAAHTALAAMGAEPVMGDLTDRPSLDRACEGVDTVLTTAISLGRGPDDTVEAVDLAGNRSLVDAAAAAGVRHFVFVSALGASTNSPDAFMRAKAATEATLRSSGMAWTILAPNAFMDVWLSAVVAGPALAGREVVYVGSGSRRHAFVHSADVVAFALAAVEAPAARNRYLPIGGPAAFSIVDAVGVFERVLGRQVPHRGVAPGTPILDLPAVMSDMLALQDAFDSPVDMGPLAAEFGIHQTSVEAWAEGLVPAMAR
jgi:uncharacterized protein YbjT (DUF2867 family)